MNGSLKGVTTNNIVTLLASNDGDKNQQHRDDSNVLMVHKNNSLEGIRTNSNMER